jgi:hypothetical protein
MPTMYKISLRDAKRMMRYFPRSVHYSVDKSLARIHEDWVKDDFPNSPVIESWEITGESLSIVWKPMHTKYRVVAGEFIKNEHKERETMEYTPALKRLYFHGRTYKGKYCDNVIAEMKKVVEAWEKAKI